MSDIAFLPIGNKIPGGQLSKITFSKDGLVVGYLETGGNKAYLFKYNTTSKTFLAYGTISIPASIRGDANFPWPYNADPICCNYDGSIVAIGLHGNNSTNQSINDTTGCVYIYKYVGSTWIQLGNVIRGIQGRDSFGYSVSLNNDGTILCVGVTGKEYVKVYNYVEAQTDWIQLGPTIIPTFTVRNTYSHSNAGAKVRINDSGTIIAVYSPDYSSIDAYGNGCVQLYEYSNSNWIKKGQDLIGEVLFDEFGDAISLNSDGTIISIGAKGDYDSVINGIRQYDGGSVSTYKFLNGSWSILGQVINGPNRGSSYGSSVSLSSDGNTLLAGCSRGNGLQEYSGIAQVYNYNSVNNIWVQSGHDILGVNANDGFAANAGMSADGSKIAISSLGNNSYIQVYDKLILETPTLTDFTIPVLAKDEKYNITSPNTNSDGEIVYSIISDVASIFKVQNFQNINAKKVGSCLVKAHILPTAKYGYKSITRTLFVKLDPVLNNFNNLSKNITDNPFTILPPSTVSNGIFSFASSNPLVATIINNIVTIIGDGTTYITATISETDTYASKTIRAILTVTKTPVKYVNYTVEEKIYGSNYFLSTMVLSKDGKILAVANTLAKTNVYKSVNNVWIQIGQSINTIYVGTQMSINSDGTIIAIGAGYPQADQYTKIYEFINNVWVNIGQLSGWASSLSRDGRTIVCGYPQGNKTFVYKYIVNNWIQKGQYIISEIAPTDGGFGESVSISDDGNCIAIGQQSVYKSAIGINNAGGAAVVYIYDTIKMIWKKLGKTIFGNAGDYLGRVVRLNGDGNKLGLCGGKKIQTYNLVNGQWEQFGTEITDILYHLSAQITSMELSDDFTTLCYNIYRHSVFLLHYKNGSWKPLIQPIVHKNGYQGSFAQVICLSGIGDKVCYEDIIKDYTLNYVSTIRLKKNPGLANFEIPNQTIGKSFTIPTLLTNSSGIISFTSSNESIASIKGTTVTIKALGTVTITASQEETPDYYDAIISTTFTVKKLTTISNFIFEFKLADDPPFPIPTLITNSDGDIKYTSSNPLVASILNNIVSIHKIGTTIITATQQETDMFFSASKSSLLSVIRIDNIFEKPNLNIFLSNINSTKGVIVGTVNNIDTPMKAVIPKFLIITNNKIKLLSINML